MSKKFKVGTDLKYNIKNDCELFYLNDFKDYDFYNKLSARDAVRTKVYNVLAGKQNALNREDCRVECADSDDREAIAAGIADALKRYIRDELDYAADTSISFIV